MAGGEDVAYPQALSEPSSRKDAGTGGSQQVLTANLFVVEK